jgi:hypothetical protein
VKTHFSFSPSFSWGFSGSKINMNRFNGLSFHTFG